MKKVGWPLLFIMALGVTGYAIAVGIVPSFGPQAIKAKFTSFPLPLWVHTIGGGIALTLGAFQVHPGIRTRTIRSHRTLGKIYLAAVFSSGLAGLYMGTQAEGGWITDTGFIFLAIFWLSTASMALLRIRQKNIAAHRAWMIRNYALTLSAVTLRIYLPLSLSNGIDFLTAYMFIAWMCWVPNLIIAEWFFVRDYKTPKTHLAMR